MYIGYRCTVHCPVSMIKSDNWRHNKRRKKSALYSSYWASLEEPRQYESTHSSIKCDVPVLRKSLPQDRQSQYSMRNTIWKRVVGNLCLSLTASHGCPTPFPHHHSVSLLLVVLCMAETMDKGTSKTPHPTCRLYWCLIECRLDIQSVMRVFSTPLVNCCPSIFSLTSPTPPPLPKLNVQYVVLGWGGCWVVL